MFAGASEVVDLVRRRAAAGSTPAARDDPYRLVLAIEGGVIRGAVTGGMALEIAELGLLPVFDAVYGSSAGAITGAWLTSSGPEGLVGWTEPAYTRMLITPHGPLRRRPVIDVKTLAEVVYTRHAPLDFASVLRSAVPWHPLATDAATGEAVDLRPWLRVPADVQLAIRASSAIPVLAGPPVRIGHRVYFDAGVAEPIPYLTAVAQGASHVLVLRSRRPGDVPRKSLAPHAAARTMLRRYPPAFRRALVASSSRYLLADDLLSGRRHEPVDGAALAAIRPADASAPVSRFSTDREAVTAAFQAGRQAVRSVLVPADPAT